MELNTQFETYLIINDEEYHVEVMATGDLLEDGFTHEFGFEHSNYIDNVFITGIYNVDTNEQVSYLSLDKSVKKQLLELATHYLNEQETDVELFKEGYYD